MKRRAFTLLELLLVLALITAVSALGVASYRRQYARAQFKSALVALQIDLNRTRLLAMRTGEAYLFRYAPGSGIYEIAPLRTLQEAIYRANGETEESSDALGGSLSTVPGADTRQYSDDLFSQENILADLAEAGRTSARPGASAVDLTSPLAGSLAAPASATDYSALGYDYMPSSDPFAASNADAFGVGGQFSLEGGLASSLTEGAMTTTLRDMNVDERAIGKSENTIAWRVNMDGLVVRKSLSGDAIFTFSRISLSTPTNLRDRRPGSAETSASNGEQESEASEGVDFGSRLGGSLTSVPSGESNDALGGGLNATPGFDEQGMVVNDSTISYEGGVASAWSEPILFYPNGKTSTVVIGLASIGRYEYYSEIGLRGMTGYARISAISSMPPGVRANDSALTQEQLFRLTHPTETGVAVSGSGTGAATVGLGGTSTSNVLESSTEQSTESASDLLNASSVPGASSGAFAPQYGSTSGRGGYRFDAPSGSTGAGAIAPPSGSDSLFDAVDSATSGVALGGSSSSSAPSESSGSNPTGSATPGASEISAPVTTTTTAGASTADADAEASRSRRRE